MYLFDLTSKLTAGHLVDNQKDKGTVSKMSRFTERCNVYENNKTWLSRSQTSQQLKQVYFEVTDDDLLFFLLVVAIVSKHGNKQPSELC